jgi:hypothetical protein
MLALAVPAPTTREDPNKEANPEQLAPVAPVASVAPTREGPRKEVDKVGRAQEGKVARQCLTPYKRNQKAAEGGWRCKMCAGLLPASYHIDHWIPLREWQGDSARANAWDNLCALCPACHAKKTARETELYADRRRERKLRVSRYFQPHSKYYIPPPDPDSAPPFLRRRLQLQKELQAKS